MLVPFALPSKVSLLLLTSFKRTYITSILPNHFSFWLWRWWRPVAGFGVIACQIICYSFNLLLMLCCYFRVNILKLLRLVWIFGDSCDWGRRISVLFMAMDHLNSSHQYSARPRAKLI